MKTASDVKLTWWQVKEITYWAIPLSSFIKNTNAIIIFFLSEIFFLINVYILKIILKFYIPTKKYLPTSYCLYLFILNLNIITYCK